MKAKFRTGARALLFDRLVDAEPTSRQEPRPLRSLTESELRESVRIELSRLLNTRCPPWAVNAPHERSVINYGIPDFSHASTESNEHQSAIALEIAESIRAFEPR